MLNDTLLRRERDLFEAYKKKCSDFAQLQLENKQLQEALRRRSWSKCFFGLFSGRNK